MSFLNDIKNSIGTYNVALTGNAFINAGKGDANIETHTGDAAIKTKDGNHTILVDVNNDLAIDTGCTGSDKIYGTAGNAWIATHDDDDTIVLNCQTLDLETASGDDDILVSASKQLSIKGGDGDKVVIAENTGKSGLNNFIALGNGNQTIHAMGDNFGIGVLNGNHTIGTVGDNHYIVTGDAVDGGTQTIGFYGNNINLDLGDGKYDIRTIDNWIKANEFTQISYTKDMGFFDHNIGLANALTYKTFGADDDGYYGYSFDGATNVNITVASPISSNLSGLITMGDGKIKLNTPNSEMNVKVLTGEGAGLLGYQAGEFRVQNGYFMYLQVQE